MRTSSHKLVTRDTDVFLHLESDVGVSLTTAHDELSRTFERRAPSVERRLEALTELNAAGISTYVFLGPLFPHLLETPDVLEELFTAVRDAGTERALLAHFNLRRYIRDRLLAQVKPVAPELVERHYQRPERSAK